jgi:hypothetical protein
MGIIMDIIIVQATNTRAPVMAKSAGILVFIVLLLIFAFIDLDVVLVFIAKFFIEQKLDVCLFLKGIQQAI